MIINHSCFSNALDSNIKDSELATVGDIMIRQTIENYKQAMFEKDFAISDSAAKKQYDAISDNIRNGDYRLPMSEHAFEYNMMRANFIKEQLQPFLQEIKAKNIGELTSEEFAQIPPELFFISRAEVKKALDEKHGGFSIKNEVPQIRVFSKDALHQAPNQQNIIYKK